MPGAPPESTARRAELLEQSPLLIDQAADDDELGVKLAPCHEKPEKMRFRPKRRRRTRRKPASDSDEEFKPETEKTGELLGFETVTFGSGSSDSQS